VPKSHDTHKNRPKRDGRADSNPFVSTDPTVATTSNPTATPNMTFRLLTIPEC
jgi:hypothetical protein